MKPQLLGEIVRSTVDDLIESDDYAMSQKLDGRRCIVQCGHNVISYGRNGNTTNLPTNIEEAFSRVQAGWVFDGEIIKNTYHVFDVIGISSGTVASLPWIERQKLTAALANFSDDIKIVPQALTSESKREHFNKCLEINAEGVVFCKIDSRYRFGLRSPLSLKYKFIKTIDCVVIGKSINDKDNLVLGLYDNNQIVDVGKISAITGDGKNYEFKIGDVVTVRYLYATKSRRLYQPVFPILREDKDPKECQINQMIMKTETIL